MTDYEIPRGQTPIFWVDRNTGRILETMHSLPLSSRSVDEIFQDNAIESAVEVSRHRSSRRRKVSRFHSEFIVAYLDNLDRLTKEIGNKAANSFMAYARGLYPEPETVVKPTLDNQVD